MARQNKTSKQRRRERRARPRMEVRIYNLKGERQPALYPTLAYQDAVLRAPEMSEVVCDKCGLAQPYVADDDGGVLPCAGPLGLGCGSETCVTIEAYADVHA